MASISASSLSPAARSRYADQLAAGAPPAKRKEPKRAKIGESDLEVIFRRQARAAKIADGMVQEFRFAASCEVDPRQWRFDFAWPARRIAIEIDGGTWNGGGHVRGAYIEETCDKINRAMDLGWRVYRATTNMVTDGRAVKLLEQVLAKGTG